MKKGEKVTKIDEIMLGDCYGYLVFRGGKPRCDDEEAEEDEARANASHCYFAVPPVPGTLWLFPGTVPHCVLPIVPGHGQQEEGVGGAGGGSGGAGGPDDHEALDPRTARISFAINFDDACPEPASG